MGLNSIIFGLLFWTSCALAQNVQSTESIQNFSFLQIETEGRELVSKTLNKIRTALNNTSLPCSCINQTLCYCCIFINIQQIRLNETACFVVSYDSQNVVTTFTASLNDRTIFQRNISSLSPPPLCFPVLQIPGTVICVRLANLIIAPTRIQLCPNLQVRDALLTLFNYNFDCISYSVRNGFQIISTTTTRRPSQFFGLLR